MGKKEKNILFLYITFVKIYYADLGLMLEYYNDLLQEYTNRANVEDYWLPKVRNVYNKIKLLYNKKIEELRNRYTLKNAALQKY